MYIYIYCIYIYIVYIYIYIYIYYVYICSYCIVSVFIQFVNRNNFYELNVF